jgi:MFS family permease
MKSLFSFQWPAKLLLFRGALVLVGGFLVHLTLGTIYTFGNIAPYIVSYIHNQSHPRDLRQATTSWIFACSLMGQGGAMFVGGWLVGKIGPRLTTLLGSAIMSTGVLVTYVLIKVSFWAVLLTYGIMYGIGVGVAYIGPLSSAMKWMPKWKGIANGIVVSGFGLGALIFDAVQTGFVNPKNAVANSDSNDSEEKYFTDAELLSRVPTLFLILGGTYAVMQLVGSLLVTDPPDNYLADSANTSTAQEGTQLQEIDDRQNCVLYEPVGDDPQLPDSKEENIQIRKSSPSYGSNSSSPRANSPTPSNHSNDEDLDEQDSHRDLEKKCLLDDEEKGDVMSLDHRKADFESSIASSTSWTKNVVTSLSPLQVLRKMNFYILWFMFLFNGIAVLFTATLYKFFGNSFIDDDHFLATVGSIAAVFNCLGRIAWGLIADRVSYKFALVLLAAIMTIFTLTFYSCSLGGKGMFFIWVCVIFFCIGGNFSLFPTAIGRAFGLKYVSINYGLLFTSQVVAGAVGAILSSTLKSLIHYYGLMFLVSGFSAIGFLLALIYRPKRYIILGISSNNRT